MIRVNPYATIPQHRCECQTCVAWSDLERTVSGMEAGRAAAALHAAAVTALARQHAGTSPEDFAQAEALTCLVLAYAFYGTNVDLCCWSIRENHWLPLRLGKGELDTAIAEFCRALQPTLLREVARELQSRS